MISPSSTHPVNVTMSINQNATEVPAYFVEPEQLAELRAINKALYGDGTPLTPDRRRDLANALNVLLGSIEKQTLDLTRGAGQ